MATEKKVVIVEELKQKFSTSKSVVIADYRGLNVKEVTELRRKLGAQGIDYKVAKNTLALIAAKDCGVDGLDDILSGPTALAFGFDDPVSPAKILFDFAKEHKNLEIKGGVIEGKAINFDQVKSLASLPPKEVLIARVLGGLQSPIAGLVNVLQGSIRNVVYVLDAIRQQKEA